MKTRDKSFNFKLNRHPSNSNHNEKNFFGCFRFFSSFCSGNNKSTIDEDAAFSTSVSKLKLPSIMKNSSKNKINNDLSVVPVCSGQRNNDNMVRLNVYGLTSLNQVIRYTGIGVYHSGVEVYGVEWAYGGYPYPVSSIFRMRQPRDLASLSDINGKFQFVQSIQMDRTKFTYEEIKMIVSILLITNSIYVTIIIFISSIANKYGQTGMDRHQLPSFISQLQLIYK